MFYNVSYANTDEALAANDGVLILAYMCEVILLEIKRNKTRTPTVSALARTLRRRVLIYE